MSADARKTVDGIAIALAVLAAVFVPGLLVSRSPLRLGVPADRRALTGSGLAGDISAQPSSEAAREVG